MRLRTRYLALAGTALLAVVLLSALLLRIGVLSPENPNPGVLSMIALGGVLFLWAGGHVLDRPFHARLNHLAARVRRMSEGEFEERPGMGEYEHDLRELAVALHNMAEQLEGRLAELERQRDEMQAIIDSIAEGVIALTDDARVLRMNATAAGLLDLSRPPPFAPIGALVRHPELRDHLESSAVGPLPPREVRIGERHLLLSSHLMREGGSVVTFLDVTRLRQMEKVRRDFVANASHELKTPLTAVRGFAETLLEEEPPEELRRRFLQSIRDNTVRLQDLVDDLLDLSRVESGTWRQKEEEIDVAESAREVWRDLASDGHGDQVHFRVDGDATALADPQALHQIFRNLFENALRYTEEEGSIRVRIDSTGAMIQVAVMDTGRGVSSSALPRIFERFYRADSGRDRGAGGTGLGLAIVRHLVQSMGGEVGAESELGRGTTIRFSLRQAVEETD